MPTIGAVIGREQEKKLVAAVSHPTRHPGIHRALARLGDTIVLHRPDGSKVSRLVTAHWPDDEWTAIRAAYYAKEYVATSDGCVHFQA